MKLNFNIELKNPIYNNRRVKQEIINNFFNNTLKNKYLGRWTKEHILVYKGVKLELINISVIVRFIRKGKIDYREILKLDTNNSYANKSLVRFIGTFYNSLEENKINLNTITKVSIKIAYKINSA